MVRNLSILALLHYVYGAIVLVLGLLVLALFGMGHMLADLAAEHAGPDAPAEWLLKLFTTFGVLIAAILSAWGLLIMLSGGWIARQRNRTASMVVAAVCLLSFPLGTALGVFTLVVLSDEEVRNAYCAGRWHRDLHG